MAITDALRHRPATTSPTFPLIRVRDFLRGVLLHESPLFLASHWRCGRSFPCLQPLLSICPWCAGCEARHHAYIPAAINNGAQDLGRYILELPVNALPEMTDFYGSAFFATRRSKHSQVTIDLKPLLQAPIAQTHRIAQRETLRTIAKVYALPDPDAYPTEALWLNALKTRITNPDYTPGRAPA